MNKKTLTPAAINNLRVGRLDDIETPGLRLEVTTGGKRVWRYRRRIVRSTIIVEMKLGSFPAHSVADARQWARNLNAETEAGRDPRVSLKSASLTVAEAYALYEADVRSGKRKPIKESSIAEKVGIFGRTIKPAIGDNPIADVTEKDLWTIIKNKSAVAPVQANRTAAELSVFFKWCRSPLGEEALGFLLPVDPTTRLRAFKNVETERKRWFDDEELALFLRAVADEPRARRRAALYLLLTGARLKEAVEAPASEVSNGVWQLPGGVRTKNAEPHRIALGAWGRRLVETNTVYLFESDGGLPMRYNWGRFQDRVLKRMTKLAGREIEPFVMHDLRRTARSHWSKLRVDTVIKETMMNHKRKDLLAIYDQWEADELVEDGFNRWDVWLSNFASRLGLAEALEVPSVIPPLALKPAVNLVGVEVRGVGVGLPVA